MRKTCWFCLSTALSSFSFSSSFFITSALDTVPSFFPSKLVGVEVAGVGFGGEAGTGACVTAGVVEETSSLGAVNGRLTFVS